MRWIPLDGNLRRNATTISSCRVAGLSRNFRFELHLCAKSYAVYLIGSCSDHCGVFWVASRLALAVPLTVVGLFAASNPASRLTPVPAEGLLIAPFGVSHGSLSLRQGLRRDHFQHAAKTPPREATNAGCREGQLRTIKKREQQRETSSSLALVASLSSALCDRCAAKNTPYTQHDNTRTSSTTRVQRAVEARWKDSWPMGGVA